MHVDCAGANDMLVMGQVYGAWAGEEIQGVDP